MDCRGPDRLFCFVLFFAKFKWQQNVFAITVLPILTENTNTEEHLMLK